MRQEQIQARTPERRWRMHAAAALPVASHLAVGPALYVLGAAACTSQLSGLDFTHRGRPAAFAGGVVLLTTCGAYLLDRVKLLDRWLDPADDVAHPGRSAFITRYSARVRTLSLVMLVLAGALARALVPWGPLLPLIAALGVVAYAPRRRGARPRPKDLVLLKSAYAALGITGLSILLALAASAPGSGLGELWRVAMGHAAGILVTGSYVALRVAADATLCDLDDLDADRRFGTATLATQLGRERAWSVAMWTRVGTSLLILWIPALPLAARLGWAGVTVASSMGLRVASPPRLRSWVDLRFLMEAGIVQAALASLRGIHGLG